MKYYIGTTDFHWYDHLSKMDPEDVNFWQPGGQTSFKALIPGAPFLFKLKSPYNAIAGIGFFSSHTFLPLSIAWDAFQEKNGCENLDQLRAKIFSYRKISSDTNPTIGCIVLTNPIFFKQEDWIVPPVDWAKSIVQGKSYNTEEKLGSDLWNVIQQRLEKYLNSAPVDQGRSQLILENGLSNMYKDNVLTKVRLGQGAFRILITDAYSRKCSITGEKTLPVLEAAHIKPYAKLGPHFISNGLLLRSDIHKLFDSGYITITTEFNVEVSKRIKEEFQNGKEYYQYHGSQLKHIPANSSNLPAREYILWHNETCFKG